MSELAVLLRAWRERLLPADVGMPAGSGRRAVGLRRQELAVLAGVSVDYLDRLEQGRATNPSAGVLSALAGALRLSEAERDHLFRAAGLAEPGTVLRQVPAGVARMVDRWVDIPAGVFTVSWSLAYWNPAWTALFGGRAQFETGRRADLRQGEGRSQRRSAGLLNSARQFTGLNLALAQFTSGLPMVVFEPAERDRFEAALCSDLRVAVARYPDDRELGELVSGLREQSPRFAALWAAGTVTEHASDAKLLRHPVVGELRLDCDVLAAPGGLHVVAYSAAPGTPDADRLADALEDPPRLPPHHVDITPS